MDKQEQNVEELEVSIFHWGMYNPTDVQSRSILYKIRRPFECHEKRLLLYFAPQSCCDNCISQNVPFIKDKLVFVLHVIDLPF